MPILSDISYLQKLFMCFCSPNTATKNKIAIKTSHMFHFFAGAGDSMGRPDHVQMFWKHKCFGNISDRSTNQRPGFQLTYVSKTLMLPKHLCFQNTYASKTLAHDPALNKTRLHKIANANGQLCQNYAH